MRINLLVYLLFVGNILIWAQTSIDTKIVIIVTQGDYEKIAQFQPQHSLGSVDIDLTPWFQSPGSQGEINNCVAWSIAYVLGYYHSQGKDLELDSSFFSPSFIFNSLVALKMADPEKGCESLQAINFVKENGCCLWNRFPYTQNVSAPIPSDVKMEAKKYRITKYQKVKVKNFYQALAQGEPILVYLPWYRNVDNLSKENPIWEDCKLDYLGRHAITIIGYNATFKRYKFTNSRGKEYGQDGYGWITSSLLQMFEDRDSKKTQNDPVDFEAYIVTPSINNIEKNGPIPIIRELLRSQNSSNRIDIIIRLGELGKGLCKKRNNKSQEQSEIIVELIANYLQEDINTDVRKAAIVALGNFKDIEKAKTVLKNFITNFSKTKVDLLNNQGLISASISSLVKLEDSGSIAWILKFLKEPMLNMDNLHSILASLIHLQKKQTLAYLFSVEIKFQHDLDNLDNNMLLPEGLQNEFENKKISLSKNATATFQVKGIKWLINDKDKNKKYYIIKEKNTLNIYTSVFTLFIEEIEKGDLAHTEKFFYILGTALSSVLKILELEDFHKFLFAMLAPEYSWKTHHLATEVLYQVHIESVWFPDRTNSYQEELSKEANKYIKSINENSDALSYTILGYIYYLQNELEQAKFYYKQSLMSSKHSYTYLMLGRCFLETSDTEMALHNFQNAINKDSENIIAVLWKLRTTLTDLPEEKKDVPQKFKEMMAKNLSSLDVRLTNFKYLTTYCEKEEYVKSIQIILQSLPLKSEIQPSLIPTLLAIARYWKSIKKEDEALRSLQQAFCTPHRLYESSIIYELMDINKGEGLLRKIQENKGLQNFNFNKKISRLRLYR